MFQERLAISKFYAIHNEGVILNSYVVYITLLGPILI